MSAIYIYISIGIIATVISYIFHRNKEKDISETIQDKLHELRDDGSFSFRSANIVGYLLAFIISTLFWPVLVAKKILRR